MADSSDDVTADGVNVSLERKRLRPRMTDQVRAQAGALAAAGASSVAVAAALGLSETSARRAMASPVAQALQTQLLRDTVSGAKAQLADGAEEAAVRLRELVRSDRDDTALRASNSILDRVGVGASSTVRHVREQTADELAASYAEALRILRAAGELP